MQTPISQVNWHPQMTEPDLSFRGKEASMCCASMEGICAGLDCQASRDIA
jgi:hypothetical protein